MARYMIMVLICMDSLCIFQEWQVKSQMWLKKNQNMWVRSRGQ